MIDSGIDPTKYQHYIDTDDHKSLSMFVFNLTNRCSNIDIEPVFSYEQLLVLGEAISKGIDVSRLAIRSYSSTKMYCLLYILIHQDDLEFTPEYDDEMLQYIVNCHSVKIAPDLSIRKDMYRLDISIKMTGISLPLSMYKEDSLKTVVSMFHSLVNIKFDELTSE